MGASVAQVGAGGSPAADAARPWLAHYPAAVPTTIDEGRLGTLVDIFRAAVAEHAARPAVESFGKRITYAELGEAAAAVTSWLQRQGLRKGDRVAIMLPNVMAYPPILFGILSAGCAVVNVNPLYTPRELTHQLKDSGARALFVLENFGHTIEEALPDLALDRIAVVSPGDLLGLKGALVNLVSRHVRKEIGRAHV
jgi:long-chain acyl-CoA synthetase